MGKMRRIICCVIVVLLAVPQKGLCLRPKAHALSPNQLAQSFAYPARTEDELKHRLAEFMRKGEYPFKYEEHLLFDNFTFVKAMLEGKILLPSEIEIHPTSRCNLGCLFCAGADKKLIRHFSLSEEELVKAITDINELNSQETNPDFKVKTIRFAGITGEPLLNPATAIAMQRAIEDGYEVGLVTNGTLLNDRIRRIIVNGKYIHVSLDAATADTFSRLKGVEPKLFKTTVNNIRELVKLKHEIGSGLEIGMGIVLTVENYHELLSFIHLAKNIGVDYVRVRAPEGVAAGSISNSQWKKIYADLDQAAAFKDDTFRIIFTDETKSGTVKPDFQSCPAHLFLTIIGPQGNICPCCHVVQILNLSFGNIKQLSLKEIWVGRNRQEALARLDPSKVCPTCPPRAARLNNFLQFLIDEQSKNPNFVHWLESWVKTCSADKEVVRIGSNAATLQAIAVSA